MMMGAWLLALPAAGRAQDSFPDHPVRVVIPYSAGSVADVFGRIVTQNMAAQWNGSIIIKSDIKLWAKVIRDAGIPPD